MREKLKYANEDVSEISQQLAAAHKEIVAKDKTITMLQRDLGSRSSNDIIDDESHMHQLNDLETELSEKSDLLGELQDKLRVYQDTCDELKAENERLKQKWMAQKRTMQKSHSIPSSGMVSKKRLQLNNRHLLALTNVLYTISDPTGHSLAHAPIGHSLAHTSIVVHLLTLG